MSYDETQHPFAGQCFCYPTKAHGTCGHCNRARMYLEREVYCMVNEVGERACQEVLEEGRGHIENLYPEPEYTEDDACPDCGSDLYTDSLGDLRCFDDAEGVEDCPWSYEFEPRPREVATWFIVSPWLQARLQDQGAVVADYLGLSLWGRCAGGQCVTLDGTFQAISRALYGEGN